MMKRILLALMFLTVSGSSCWAQINWNITYSDGNIQTGGSGFADPTVNTSIHTSKSLGQLRRESVIAATTYLNTILDGRGSVNITWNTSLSNSNSGVLASFGPSGFIGTFNSNGTLRGSFQNGRVYQAARSNERPSISSTGADGSGQFNFFDLIPNNGVFDDAWNYATQTASPASNRYDMTSVAIHEIVHGLGFTTGMNSTGRGLFATDANGTTISAGSPNVYGEMARYLQRGNGDNGTPTKLFNTTLTSTGYGSYTGTTNDLVAGNNATSGLFYGGEYGSEVFGRAIPIYAPSPFESGSSLSHVNDSNAIMNPSIGTNSVRRLLRYEVGMMLDLGWNVYNWDNAAGSWDAGINNDGTFTLNNSNWRTNQGIALNSAGGSHNINATPSEAFILPIYGQVSSNNILNFAGSGTGNYTSTNNFTNNILVSRLNLNSTSTNTTGNTITGGTLSFGRNSDGTASALIPKIVQKGSGRWTIASNIITNDVSNPSSGWKGTTGIIVEGSGSGTVTLSGKISGTGSMTFAGKDFTTILSGTNDYTGKSVFWEGTVEIQTLANGGNDSHLGKATNAATNLEFSGGILKYTGAGSTSDRLFTISTRGGTLDSSGSGTLQFTNTGDIASIDTASITLSRSSGSKFLATGELGPVNVVVGQTVTGTGIASGTTVTAVTTQGITLSNNASSTGTDSVSFGFQTRTLTLTGTQTGSNLIAGRLQNTSNGTTLAINKTGTGTWILSGNNTYSGTTTVNAGRLFINGSTASGSSVTVNNGGTLGGNGTINGMIDVKSGATLVASDRTASLSSTNRQLNTGALTLNRNSRIQTVFNHASGNPTESSVVSVTGSVNLGTSSENLVNSTNNRLLILLEALGSSYTFDSTQSITLLTASNGILLNGSATSNNQVIASNLYELSTSNLSTQTGGNFSLNIVNGTGNVQSLILQFTPVPEPGTILLCAVLLAGGGQGFRRWQKRRAKQSSTTEKLIA